MTDYLYEGRALEIMETIQDNSIQLIYLDPPFFTNRSHEATNHHGVRFSFEDVWKNGIDDYLKFMQGVLRQCRRVVKNEGSVFLHCDWHAIHYLKIEMDRIFGYHNFRNEVIWKRHNSQNNHKQGAKIFGRIHDSILVYSKSSQYTWHQLYEKYSDEYLKKTYKYIDEKTGERYALGDLSGPGGASKGNPYYEFLGFRKYWRYNLEKMNKLLKEGKIVQTEINTVPKLKRYLKDMKGIPLSDIWTDIANEQTTNRKSILYPTQKPLKLLERIIECSTTEGDLILDPFCGSGTTLICASKLDRNWIGIDSNPIAIDITKNRLSQNGVSGWNYNNLAKIAHKESRLIY